MCLDLGTTDRRTNGLIENQKKKILHFQNHRAMKRPEKIFWAKTNFFSTKNNIRLKDLLYNKI